MKNPSHKALRSSPLRFLVIFPQYCLSFESASELPPPAAHCFGSVEYAGLAGRKCRGCWTKG
jgi:hypothetical protein